MKVLLINKFLYPKGGSETYFLKLGQELERKGHEVQYFGMFDDKNTVGNLANSYVSNVDFHTHSKLSLIKNAFKTINSKEARKKIRLVLETFKPDVCHLNNFNYQLTPSIIVEIKKWNKTCKIIYTAHDGQLVCPNHSFKNPSTGNLCEKCVGGHFWNCFKNKCVHNSKSKSLIGSLEAIYWKNKKVYNKIDSIICCSNFMKTKLDTYSILKNKTVVIHNFVEKPLTIKGLEKKDYVLYFGRYSSEKGIKTLIDVAKRTPDVIFVFAGSGPLAESLVGLDNVRDLGFLSGEKLARVIAEAKLTICPSECYENCPFSVMESLQYGTPVLGSNIGGIPELIKEGINGELFESGNAEDLRFKILSLIHNPSHLMELTDNSKECDFLEISRYVDRLLAIYNC